MFDGGVPEQIHRFMTSPPAPPPPHPPLPATERSLPLSFSPFNTNHETQHMVNLESRKNIIHFHHHHHHHDIKDGEWISHDDHHHHHHHGPWCSDEVLALLRFRSTVENWLPEFTWEHTSRKLTEIGFKRSPQECKEKYEEEERRYFSSNNDHINNYNSNKGGNYRMFSEVEEFYHHDHDDVDDDDHASSEVGVHNQNKSHNSVEEEPKTQENVNENGQNLLEEDKREEEDLKIEKSMKTIDVDDDDDDNKSSSSSCLMKEKKRKRKKKEKERFSVLKGFCESLVRNMMIQQEEMHKKLLEDMLKRDKEKIAKDEALKNQEMERIKKEIEVRAQEQAIANDRSTNIIKFISNFTHHDHDHVHDHHEENKVQSPSASQGSSSLAQSRKSQTLIPDKSPLLSLQSNKPISIQTLKTKTQIPKPTKSDEKSDLGKRWPRDEVLTLVNIRRSISTMNMMNDDDDQNHHHQDGISKAVPLWERISKKMLENGYKRSAKRCKEKWENINKYFRKTKDVNKKRPLDSRTCPYFHQLTALYSQGSTATSVGELASEDPETRPGDNRVGSGEVDVPTAMNVDADGTGQRSNVDQFSSFDLEF